MKMSSSRNSTSSDSVHTSIELKQQQRAEVAYNLLLKKREQWVGSVVRFMHIHTEMHDKFLSLSESFDTVVPRNLRTAAAPFASTMSDGRAGDEQRHRSSFLSSSSSSPLPSPSGDRYADAKLEETLISLNEKCRLNYEISSYSRKCEEMSLFEGSLENTEPPADGMHVFPARIIRRDNDKLPALGLPSRCIIINSHIEDLKITLRHIIDHPSIELGLIIDRFKMPDFSGYRMIMVYGYIISSQPSSSSSSSSASSSTSSSTLKSGSGNVVRTAFAIQLHLSDVIQHAMRSEVFTYAKQYSVFFDNCPFIEHNPLYFWWCDNIESSQQWQNRWKVLKKMDQVSENVECLEDLMLLYFSGQGRVAKDVQRLKNFYRLFRFFAEDDLALKIKEALHRLYRRKILQVSQQQEQQSEDKRMLVAVSPPATLVLNETNESSYQATIVGPETLLGPADAKKDDNVSSSSSSSECSECISFSSVVCSGCSFTLEVAMNAPDTLLMSLLGSLKEHSYHLITLRRYSESIEPSKELIGLMELIQLKRNIIHRASIFEKDKKDEQQHQEEDEQQQQRRRQMAPTAVSAAAEEIDTALVVDATQSSNNSKAQPNHRKSSCLSSDLTEFTYAGHSTDEVAKAELLVQLACLSAWTLREIESEDGVSKTPLGSVANTPTAAAYAPTSAENSSTGKKLHRGGSAKNNYNKGKAQTPRVASSAAAAARLAREQDKEREVTESKIKDEAKERRRQLPLKLYRRALVIFRKELALPPALVDQALLTPATTSSPSRALTAREEPVPASLSSSTTNTTSPTSLSIPATFMSKEEEENRQVEVEVLHPRVVEALGGIAEMLDRLGYWQEALSVTAEKTRAQRTLLQILENREKRVFFDRKLSSGGRSNNGERSRGESATRSRRPGSRGSNCSATRNSECSNSAHNGASSALERIYSALEDTHCTAYSLTMSLTDALNSTAIIYEKMGNYLAAENMYREAFDAYESQLRRSICTVASLATLDNNNAATTTTTTSKVSADRAVESSSSEYSESDEDNEEPTLNAKEGRGVRVGQEDGTSTQAIAHTMHLQACCLGDIGAVQEQRGFLGFARQSLLNSLKLHERAELVTRRGCTAMALLLHGGGGGGEGGEEGPGAGAGEGEVERGNGPESSSSNRVFTTAYCDHCGHTQDEVTQHSLQSEYDTALQHMKNPYDCDLVVSALNDLGEAEEKLDRVSPACWYFNEAFCMFNRLEQVKLAEKKTAAATNVLQGLIAGEENYDMEGDSLKALKLATIQCNLGGALLRGGGGSGGNAEDVARSEVLVTAALHTRMEILGSDHMATQLAQQNYNMCLEISAMIAEIEESKRQEARERIEQAELEAKQKAANEAAELKAKLLAENKKTQSRRNHILMSLGDDRDDSVAFQTTAQKEKKAALELEHIQARQQEEIERVRSRDTADPHMQCGGTAAAGTAAASRSSRPGSAAGGGTQSSTRGGETLSFLPQINSSRGTTTTISASSGNNDNKNNNNMNHKSASRPSSGRGVTRGGGDDDVISASIRSGARNQGHITAIEMNDSSSSNRIHNHNNNNNSSNSRPTSALAGGRSSPKSKSRGSSAKSVRIAPDSIPYQFTNTDSTNSSSSMTVVENQSKRGLTEEENEKEKEDREEYMKGTAGAAAQSEEGKIAELEFQTLLHELSCTSITPHILQDTISLLEEAKENQGMGRYEKSMRCLTECCLELQKLMIKATTVSSPGAVSPAKTQNHQQQQRAEEAPPRPESKDVQLQTDRSSLPPPPAGAGMHPSLTEVWRGHLMNAVQQYSENCKSTFPLPTYSPATTTPTRVSSVEHGDETESTNEMSSKEIKSSIIGQDVCPTIYGPSIASIFCQIGITLEDWGQFSSAELMFAACLNILKTVYRFKPFTGETYTTIQKRQQPQPQLPQPLPQPQLPQPQQQHLPASVQKEPSTKSTRHNLVRERSAQGMGRFGAADAAAMASAAATTAASRKAAASAAGGGGGGGLGGLSRSSTASYLEGREEEGEEKEKEEIEYISAQELSTLIAHEDIAQCLLNIAVTQRIQRKHFSALHHVRLAREVYHKVLTESCYEGSTNSSSSCSSSNTNSSSNTDNRILSRGAVNRSTSSNRRSAVAFMPVLRRIDHLEAQCLFEQSQFEEAREIMQRVYKDYEEILSKEQVQNGRSGIASDALIMATLNATSALNTKALVDLCDNKLEEALSMFECALEMREKVLGKAHQSLDVIRSNIGILYVASLNFTRAGNIFTQCIEFREKSIGAGSEDMITALNNMAYMLKKQKDKANAAPFLTGVSVIKKFLRSPHPK